MNELKLGDRSDTCLNCNESEAAIRKNRLYCSILDYWGEVVDEWEHHEFVVTKKRIAEWAAMDKWIEEEKAKEAVHDRLQAL